MITCYVRLRQIITTGVCLHSGVKRLRPMFGSARDAVSGHGSGLYPGHRANIRQERTYDDNT